MKTRNMDDLNLKDAFPPIPDTYHAALMNAARSAKEEKNMKRASFRAVLIAAVILAATMAVAFAATQLGLIDLFKNNNSIALPDSAKTVLSSTEQKTYTVGPLTITLRETLADGRIAYVTTQAKPDSGSSALIISDDFSASVPDSVAARLGIPGGTSFADAAKQANIPLYAVSSYLTVDEDYISGEEMQSSLWAEDGSLLLVHMLQTNPEKVPKTLTGTLTLRVRQFDPALGSYIKGNDWKTEEAISISVSGVTAEKTYTPAGEALLNGFTVQSVKAEKTCAGIYLTAALTAGAEASREDTGMLYNLVEFRDEQGQKFPNGINLSGILNDEKWPAITLEVMISTDALPDVIQMAYGEKGSIVTLK